MSLFARLLGTRRTRPTPFETQATWYFDFAQSLATTNDGNDGLTAATALATWGELISRYNGYSPTLPQAVTYNVLSSQPNANDPVSLQPYTAFVPTLQGVLGTKVAAGQIINGAAVVAKNRAVPANGQLTAPTFSGAAIGNVAVGDLLINTTHPSRCWVYKNVAGNQFDISQPLTPLGFAPTEVDTWVQTDTVSIATLPKVFMGSFVSGLFINLDLDNGNASAGTNIVLSGGFAIECRLTGGLGMSNSNVTFVNCDLNNGVLLRYRAPLFSVQGGQIRKTFPLGIGSSLNLDVILGGTGAPTYGESLVMQNVYIDTTAGSLLLFAGSTTVAASSFGPFVWGPGAIELSGVMAIPVGAGAPQAAFLLQGGAAGFLAINGTTTALVPDETADPVIWRGPRSITAALLDAAVGAGGFRNPSGQVACVGMQGSGVVRSGSL